MGNNVAALVRLMLVTDDRLLRGRDLVTLALAAERGGVTSVQLRLKQATPRDLAGLVRALVGSLRIPVLVNDRPDVAIAAGAAGVHLGPDDLPVELTRRLAPPGFIVGASVGSETEAAPAAAADYWGIGPWRATATKDDAGTGLGPAGFRRLAELGRGRPCLAIGGVTPEDVPGSVGGGRNGGGGRLGDSRAEDVKGPRGYRGRGVKWDVNPLDFLRRALLHPPDLPNRSEVLVVRPRENVTSIGSRHEVEIVHVRRVERSLDAAPAGRVHRPGGRPGLR